MRWAWFSRVFLLFMGIISICQKFNHTQKQLCDNITSLKVALTEKCYEWKKQHKHTACPKMCLKDNFSNWRGSQAGIYPFSRKFQYTQLLFVPLRTSPRSFSNRNRWRVITLQGKDWAEARLWRLLNSLLLTHTPLSKLYLSINIYT